MLLLALMPSTWDESNKIGEEAQSLLQKLLTELGFTCSPYKDGKQREADLEIKMTIEVKRDVASQTTGNYAIEYKYKGNPSGISTTTADIFAIQNEHHYYLYHTAKLKEFIRHSWKRLKKTTGGDDNLVDLILIPRIEMIDPWLSIPIDKTIDPIIAPKS